MTQVVARKPGVAVGRVLHPLQLLLAAISFKNLTWYIEQWPQQHPLPQRTDLWHARQATDSCTTEQPEQQGFRLVFAVLASQQDLTCLQGLREGRIAGITRALLEARPWGDLDIDDLQPDTQGVAQALAMRRPAVSAGLQAMMDVNRSNGREWLVMRGVDEHVQEDGGVQAAGEGDAPGRGSKPGG